MTKLELLHHLQDTFIQNDVFNRFLERYRNTFTKIISIQYSDEKYNNIDVEEIFYKDFLAYTIQKLDEPDKAVVSIDNWVPTLAQQRAKEISQKVTKSYAKYLLETGGCDNWRAFNATLMDEAFSRVVGNVVARCFDNPKYKGYFNDIRISLLLQLYEDRIGNAPELPGPIENIDSYVFQMLKNFALRRRVRETIDSELGLEDGRVNISKYLKVDAEEFDGLDEELHDFDTDDEPKQTDEDETNNCYSLDDDGECEDDETQNDTLIDDTDVPEDKILAEKRIEGLFNLMRNKDQAELLRKVMLYGYDRVELAEEMGCSRAVLDNRVSRAMMDLYEVALPQIRQECKHMVITNRDALTDEYQRDILNDYFFSNNTLKELAQAYGMNEADFTKDLIKAYKEIKSISKKTIRVFVSDKDIEKYKEEERKQEATSTLRIKFTTLKS